MMVDCACNFFPASLGNVTFEAGVNVGIGTPTPETLLQLANSGKFSFTRNVGDEANAGKIDYRGVDQTSLNIVGAGTDNTNRNVRIFDTLSIGYSGPTSGVAAFAGAVGIGTSSPVVRLDVRGGHLVLDPGLDPKLYTGTAGAELNRYLWIMNSPTYETASGLKAGGVLVSDAYNYANPAKTDLIVKGRVGIGTADPAGNKLSVNGDAHVAGDARVAGKVAIGTTDTGIYKLNVNGDTYVAGRLNIGVTPPLFPMVVDVGNRIRVRQGDAGSAGVWLYQTGPGVDLGFVGMMDDNYIGLYGAGYQGQGCSWGFVMDRRNGNVGVGRIDPGEKLDVVGKVRASDAFYAGTRKVADTAGCYYAD